MVKHALRCSKMTPQAAFQIPPHRFEASGGFFTPCAEMRVVITAPEVQPMALAMVVPVLPAGTSRQMVVGEGFSLTWGEAEALPRLTAKPTLPNVEAFAFEVTSRGVAVRARSAEGLFRGCAWLRREVAQGQLPCGVGEDGPDLAVRGVMLDVSRNRVYSVKTVCEVVDWMAQLGLNQLELYFENVFAYRDHAAVWAQTSPYTPADLAAIEAYCAARFVHFVPNQNTLGHFERWLKHPDYLRYAELPQGGARTPWGSIQAHPTGLFAADPATRTFVKGLLEELLPCFPKATRVNLGGDEVFDLGQGRSQTEDKAGLYLSYMREMAAVAERYGKRPELWADMLLRHPEMIPHAKAMLPEAIWVVWGYEASDPLVANVARLRTAGLRVMVAPGTSSWRSFCGRTSNMVANITAAAEADAEGMLLTDWGDAGHWQPLAVALPALVLAAVKAWRRGAEPDVAAFVDALVSQRGVGELLLRLGDTYREANAEAGNATKLFQAYNLPLADAPALDREALRSAFDTLQGLALMASRLTPSLIAQEVEHALALQTLAVKRALGMRGLQRERARLAAQMEQLWLARGPRAQLDASLEAFLAPELPR